MSQLEILKGCDEFTLGDGPTGALFIHGFTSSPQNMRAMGDYLAERGIRVRAPRLPGHGTTWEDLATRRSGEWLECVESNFEALKAECDEVFLVGLSFGGGLSLELASRRSDEISGVVTLAGIVFTKDPRRFLAPVIKRVIRTIPGVGNDIADPTLKEIVYDKVPTSASAELLLTIAKAKAGLPKVTAPLLVMHGRNDHTVHPSNAQYIYDHAGSTDKELVWLERSYHVITLDYDRDEVYSRTADFIKERSKHAV
ncbi:MAG: alpha/beta hydrolase [Actinomycetota bacterium]